MGEEKIEYCGVVNTATPSSATSKDSGIIASLKKNMNQSLDQAEEDRRCLSNKRSWNVRPEQGS